MCRLSLALSLLLGCVSAARPLAEPAQTRGLENIQRTLRLLATSSAARPNRVRILFYGQSITQSAWSRKVATDLHAKYPHALLEVENRALGGFASERLLETAETDLYPWQPDLVIFHVYGAHDRYRELIARVRERTSAEVLLQTDHVTAAADLREPLGSRDNPPDAEHWSGFMNQAFLPSLVERYQVALCDLRSAWKSYLRATSLTPDALLSDAVHLNAQGDRLMASLIESCLAYRPELRSPAEDWVEELAPSARSSFVGQRVVAIVAPGTGSTHVKIDGAAPSSLGLSRFARAHIEGGDKWPPVHGIAHRAPLIPETFTLTVRRRAAHYTFQVQGSRTGDDGDGRTDTLFVSRSGRLVIEPADWDIPYAFELAGLPVPETFSVTLRVEPHAVDAFAATNEERAVTLASGLSEGPHVLELEGNAPLRKLIVYRPH
jgi:hypothetical protein